MTMIIEFEAAGSNLVVISYVYKKTTIRAIWLRYKWVDVRYSKRILNLEDINCFKTLLLRS
jgi:hypothetical protein